MSVENGKIRDYIREINGLDISIYDRSFLEKVIRNRMGVTGSTTIDEYLLKLQVFTAELADLLDQLTNSHSEFFRNSLTFSLLEQSIVPKIISNMSNHQNHEIRMWSAGCASGQEPYSLAMMLDDFKNTHQLNFNYRIFATDSSEKELESARSGMYDFKNIKNTKLERVEKYFRRTGATFQLDKRLGEQVDFSCYDLLNKDSNSPPSSIYGDFDLIMCCNVLFYYESDYQQIILNKIHRSLKPGGFFITGEAEIHLVNTFGGFRPFATPSAIFVKN